MAEPLESLVLFLGGLVVAVVLGGLAWLFLKWIDRDEPPPGTP
jgi:hypothetical protein